MPIQTSQEVHMCGASSVTINMQTSFAINTYYIERNLSLGFQVVIWG